MKKNIVIIPSLVLCSFIVSPLLGCEMPTANEYHPIATPTAEDIDFNEYPFLKNLLEELPEPQASTTEEQPNMMLQSVMLPMENKTIGLREHVRSMVFNNIRNVIAYLHDQTFDVEN